MSHGAGVPAALIWPWLILAAIVAGVPVLAISTAIALRARSARASDVHAGRSDAPAARTGKGDTARARESDTPPARASYPPAARTGKGDTAPARESHPPAAPAGRRGRRWGAAGLAAGALLGLLLFAAGRAQLVPLACAGGYLAGLLAEQYTAQPAVPRGHLRAASLRARRALDYAPRWAISAATAAAVLVVASPLAFALAPAVRYLSWQPFPGAGFRLPGGTTTWPGPTAAGPAAVAAVSGLLVAFAGLRRIASRPLEDGAASAGQPNRDSLARQRAGRAIAGTVLGFELMALGATLIAGSSGLAVPVQAIAPGAYVGSRLMIDSGLCCAVAAVLSWLTLSGRMSRRRSSADRDTAGLPAPPGS